MNRITARLADLRSQGRKALVAYIVSGDPYLKATLPAMHGLVEQGVDIIELGIAFSDPMAEGPVIQAAHERALVNGASLKLTLEVVKAFRQTNRDTPVVLMGYANSVERMGYTHFASVASDAGVDGLLTVDLPAQEAVELNKALIAVGIENIFLLAPTTSRRRAEQIVCLASGFLYYVSLKGVTGAGHLDVGAVEEKLAELRQLTDLPLCVGFGIKDAEAAKAVAAVADGVVVGSVLVEKMGSMGASSAVEISAALAALIAPIRRAVG